MQQSSFLEQIMGNSPEIIHFETWAWSWSWFWKALSWTRGQAINRWNMFLYIYNMYQRLIQMINLHSDVPETHHSFIHVYKGNFGIFLSFLLIEEDPGINSI